MEEISTRAVVIGISIFVTMAILSLIMVTFNHMKEIFALVKHTDNSLHTAVDHYDTQYTELYDGKKMNGLELLNLLKKVEQETLVNITVEYPKRTNVKSSANSKGIRESQRLKELMDSNTSLSGHTFKYERIYNTSVVQTPTGIKIKFE